jgi:hypothetical protein
MWTRPTVAVAERRHSSAELRMFRLALQDGREAVDRRSASLANWPSATALQRSPYIPGEIYCEATSPTGSTRPGRRQSVSLPGPAPRSSPRILAPAWPSVLTATRDGRHGRLLASRPGRLLPLPPGRQTLPSHLPTRRMAGPATCPANTCRPGPLPPLWRDRSQHSGCPTQAARGRCRPSPATWPACRLTWKAYG